MSNVELIAQAAQEKNFPYNGKNLLTFQEWKKLGKSVKKGEKAFLSVPLWKKVYWTDKETGEEKSKFVMTKTAHLFTIDQVQ